MANPIDSSEAVTNPEKIRVLFVAHDSQLQGAQLTLLSILTHLDRSRFVPFVVTPRSGPFTDAVARMDIPVWTGLVMRWVYRRNPVALKYLLGAPWRILRTPAIFALFLGELPIRLGRLLLLFHRQRIDIVYTNTITVVDGAIAAKIMCKPHIWHLHEDIEATPGLLRVLPACYVATSLPLKLSTRIAVPSHALREKIFGLQLALPKVEVIHNGVDTRQFSPKAPTHFLHSQFDIPLDVPLVGICGAIQESKGHEIFVKAAAKISRTCPQAHFVVIGRGQPEYLRHLADMARGLGIANRLLYTGWRTDIPEIFRELQVLVIASKQEAFGLTAIEGMATGIPVVSTRCGGPEEVIKDGETGYLVDQGNHVEIAQRVIELLASDELRHFLGRAGQEHAEQFFSVECCVAKIEQLIEKAQSDALTALVR